MAEGRMPDFVIKALNKNDEQRDIIGAGWQREDGSIYLRFNRFVTVPVGVDYMISMFPADKGNTRAPENDEDYPRSKRRRRR